MATQSERDNCATPWRKYLPGNSCTFLPGFWGEGCVERPLSCGTLTDPRTSYRTPLGPGTPSPRTLPLPCQRALYNFVDRPGLHFSLPSASLAASVHATTLPFLPSPFPPFFPPSTLKLSTRFWSNENKKRSFGALRVTSSVRGQRQGHSRTWFISASLRDEWKKKLGCRVRVLFEWMLQLAWVKYVHVTMWHVINNTWVIGITKYDESPRCNSR